MPDENKLDDQAGGDGQAAEEVMRLLGEHRKPPNGDDTLPNPELEQLLGSLLRGLEEGVPDSVLGIQPAGPLALEELAADLAKPLAPGELPLVQPAGEAVVACASCGSANPAVTRFCGMCGHELDHPASSEKVSGNGSEPAAALRAAPKAPASRAEAARRNSGRGWKIACLALLCLLFGLVLSQQQLWRHPLVMNRISSSPAMPSDQPPAVTVPAKPAAGPAPLVPAIRRPNPSATSPKTAPPTTVRQDLPGPAPLASPSPQQVELPAVVEVPSTAPMTANTLVTPEPPSVEAASAPASPAPIRVAQVSPGVLIYKVNPQYPPAARSARVQGSVVMRATIGTDGTIQQLRVVSGNPLLVNAAMDAVKKWRYRPYLLDGKPVEGETNITINFKGE
jgi:protein TonB